MLERLLIELLLDSEGRWQYNVFKNPETDIEDECADGGCCTTTINNAIEMAKDMAKDVAKKEKYLIVEEREGKTTNHFISAENIEKAMDTVLKNKCPHCGNDSFIVKEEVSSIAKMDNGTVKIWKWGTDTKTKEVVCAICLKEVKEYKDIEH
jgi:endogenous inhibitor of DNA gyrase (YacG/DUF329 family)